MGTPFIAFLGPTANLTSYERQKLPSSQSSTIPKTFLDAMEVRNQVFVEEQHCSFEEECDYDDHRSCHWVVYASINTTKQKHRVDPNGHILTPKQSITQSTPIGTIRLVPFPHTPHPTRGTTSTPTSTTGAPVPLSYVPPYAPDRPTTLHDGSEPYLKLGRLAVILDFRGQGISTLLINTAISWARQNPTFFNPKVSEVGMEKLGARRIEEVPVWKGLVCVHAQTQVKGMWTRAGFEHDEGMGTWDEEGIEHIGMFLRLKLDNMILEPVS